jgi:hypothetical protein
MTDRNADGHFIIYLVRNDPVITFASQELCRYLQQMTGCPVVVESAAAFQPGLGGFWLGLIEDFPGLDSPGLSDELDDAISIQVHNGQGVIAGMHGRSVLLAVYRFLSEAGCRWVRPGAEGEVIPQRSLANLIVHLVEQPSYRHRAICIEGAVSLENIFEIIDWAPKVGFSGYFMQFREGHTFFERWYSHKHNPLLKPEAFTVEQARGFTRQIEAELAKRGMLYHAVGHGWTCEAFGIPGLGWDPVVQDWPAEVINSLALVNGQRQMWHDIPLITSLCFSNPQVRRSVVDGVVAYVQAHPNIQALHFWLDDGFNNKCECSECQKMRPADYYVILLNELDEALSRSGYPGKVVFLAYADLLWPPEVEQIQNPERFILMFAPITRSYRKPLFPQDESYVLPPYVRNQLVFSENNDEQLAFLRAWQKLFQGDSFIFDYHLMQAGVYTLDPDPIFLSRLLYTDLQNLRQLGLNGYVSCQIQRIFFPTGLVMYVMGRTLWNDGLRFDDLVDEYFNAAFGSDGRLCQEYLAELSALQDVVPVREKGLEVDPQAQIKLQWALKLIQDFQPVITRNLTLPDRCQRKSWFYLQAHAELMQRYLRLLSAKAAGEEEAMHRLWEEIKRFAQEQELSLQPVFDTYEFIDSFEHYFAT